MSRLRRPTVAIVVTLLICLTCLSPVTLPAAQAGYRVNRFAAIAYSPLTGRYGLLALYAGRTPKWVPSLIVARVTRELRPGWKMVGRLLPEAAMG